MDARPQRVNIRNKLRLFFCLAHHQEMIIVVVEVVVVQKKFPAVIKIEDDRDQGKKTHEYPMLVKIII